MSGDGGPGAYVCSLTVTSDGLTMAPGGAAGAYVAAIAREYAAPVAAAAVAAAPTATVDMMRFTRQSVPLLERPQRSRTGYLGSPRLSRKQLATLSAALREKGVQLIIDKKGVLPSFARAGFDPASGKMYLRKGATYFEAFHETQHAEQWVQLGATDYQKQTRYEREKYVFDRIKEQESLFSKEEIQAATNYINSLT